jgi:hypothetical protein
LQLSASVRVSGTALIDRCKASSAAVSRAGAGADEEEDMRGLLFGLGATILLGAVAGGMAGPASAGTLVVKRTTVAYPYTYPYPDAFAWEGYAAPRGFYGPIASAYRHRNVYFIPGPLPYHPRGYWGYARPDGDGPWNHGY